MTLDFLSNTMYTPCLKYEVFTFSKANSCVGNGICMILGHMYFSNALPVYTCSLNWYDTRKLV